MKKSKTTLFELAKQARQMGYKVKLEARGDGGYNVSSINGISFKGREGNKQLRIITGASLSAKQTAQRTEAGKTALIRKMNLEKYQDRYSKDLLEYAAKTKKVVEEGFKRQGKKGSWRPDIQLGYYKEKGLSEYETKRTIKNVRIRAEGYAYENNVEAYINTIFTSWVFQDEPVLYFKLKYLAIYENMYINDLSTLIEQAYNFKNGNIEYEDFKEGIKEVLNHYNFNTAEYQDFLTKYQNHEI